jgi:UPF0716 protein FxsA
VLARLFVVFVIVPLVELWLLLLVAEHTDWLFTLGLVIFTGSLGMFLARRQGLRTVAHIRQELAAGQMPTDSLLDALMILIAGLVLMTPGILTDALGFALLIPPSRRAIKLLVVAWFRRNFSISTNFPGAQPGGDRIVDSYVVDDKSDAEQRD